MINFFSKHKKVQSDCVTKYDISTMLVAVVIYNTLEILLK